MARFEPTDAERAFVRGLTAYGARQELICHEMFLERLKLAPGRMHGIGADRPLSERSLARYFKREIAIGAEAANARVAQAVYERAIDKKHPQGAISAFFWLKTRAGWSERPLKIEHGGKVSWELDLEGTTAEELEVLERVLARQAARLTPPVVANDADAA